MQQVTIKELLKCHFEDTDMLADMLASKRMTGKYGLKYGKYSRVLLANNQVYETEPHFVKLLIDRYGNMKFKDAIKKWEEENETGKK